MKATWAWVAAGVVVMAALWGQMVTGADQPELLIVPPANPAPGVPAMLPVRKPELLIAPLVIGPELDLSDTMQGRIEKLESGISERIDEALPAKPVIKPLKARKLLVFVGVKGFYHDSIPVAAVALKRMGDMTGAYEATITDDEHVFRATTLTKFDGIFMVNNCGEHPQPTEAGGNFNQQQAREDFMAYIKGGHGLMGTHAAADCSHSWAEYQDMIGGEFAGHPWGKAAVRNEDPDNQINAVFKGKGFMIRDELYTFKPLTDKRPEGYSREKLHILLSIDLEKSGYKDTTRKDGDYALSWTKTYGDGRVFYCALGHAKEDFYNPILLKHYLAGIQYALGDLETDAKPSAKLPADRKMGDAPDINDADACINVKPHMPGGGN